MRHPLTRRPRRGFTLVELLVACALTVLIMAVLATAFQAGLKTFSHLKSTVGLSEQLRSAETTMRRDLEATHLENAEGLPIRVSDLKGVTRGYFEVLQATEPNLTTFVREGIEDGVESYRATDHALFLTSKLRGDSAQEVYSGEGSFTSDPDVTDYAPAGTFVGRWAEIGLFLVPTSVMTIDDGATAGTQLKLHSLIRCQRVLATNPQDLPLSSAPLTTALKWRDAFPQASISTQNFTVLPGPVTKARVNDPSMLVTRANRLGYLATNTSPGPTETAIMPNGFGSLKSSTTSTSGADILVSNVVSMQIRVMDSRGKFFDRFTQVPNPAPAPAPPFLVNSGIAPPTSFNIAAEGCRLDTAIAGTPQMRAVQIRLRVYDTKNHLTRQMTMTFDL